MTVVLIFYLVAFFIHATWAEEFSMEMEEMKAIQERLARLEGIEKAIQEMTSREENREENCISEGSGCTFGSGLNCCGLRTRCILFDHYTPQKGGPNKWHSVCREYSGGVAADEVVQFFKKVG